MNQALSPNQPTVPAAKPISEAAILITLAGIQFTNIVDFMLMMPLGPRFMREFDITPSQFGFLVSAYSFSSAICGVLGAMFLDRFDRKRSMIFLYAGFILGTGMCAIAPSEFALGCGRVVAGAFGGLLNATTFSIIGDVFPEKRRGAATGTVMMAFSLASIIGVPFGLTLANYFDAWHAPFTFLVALATIFIFIAIQSIPPLRGHLAQKRHISPIAGILEVFKVRNNLYAFALMMSSMFAGFCLFPYFSPVLVNNVGFAETKLPLVYMFGGAATILTSRLFGKMSDKYGKRYMFLRLCITAMIPVYFITTMEPSSDTYILLVTTTFMVFISGRMVPGMALVTSAPEPRMRGSFMSLNSSLQSLASGSATFLSGLIISKEVTGQKLLHYDTVGLLACGMILLSIFFAFMVKTADQR